VCAFFFARRGWWIAAGICAAAAAGATRAVGSAAAVALAVMALQGWKTAPRSLRYRRIASIVIACAGVIRFISYLGIKFHEPLAFMTAHSANGWGWVKSWSNFVAQLDSWRSARFGNVASGNVPWLMSLHIICIALSVPMLAMVWWKLPRGYAVWTTIVLLMWLPKWAGFGRYMATMFPMFIALAATIRNQSIFIGVTIISALGLALLTILFTQNYWVG
jgi:hypothetical protein